MKKILLLIVFSKHLFSLAQNVGIGINNPSRAKLEVHGAAGATSAIFGGESTGISLQRAWPSIGFNQYYNNGSKYIGNGYAAAQFVDPTNGYMAFDFFGNGVANGLVTSSRRVMVISNEGAINMGSGAAPTSTLTVARGTAAEGTASINGSVHRSLFNNGPEENTYIRAGKNNGKVILNDVPGGIVSVIGNLGVNTGNPVFPLEVRQPEANAGVFAMVEGIGFNSWEYYIGSGGGDLQIDFKGYPKGVFRASNGQYNTISDRRLKTNIRQLLPVLSKVMQLQPVSYDMIAQGATESRNLGFIAQEVKPLFPELVNIDTMARRHKTITDLHTLNYSGFGVIAIKAIQEQQGIIQLLQDEIAELKKAVAALQKR